MIQFESKISDQKYPKGAAKFSHIMVDEFQDINPLDLQLIKNGCMYHGGGKMLPLTIVGDDDQAIFGWRGTTPRYILNPDRFFGVKFDTCVLETNYRSSKNIVEISNKLLSYNKNREPKAIRAMSRKKALIKVINTKKTLSTIETTIKLTHELLDKRSCQQVALIARRQVSLFPYQILFSAEKLPYNIASDMDIFEGEAIASLQEIIRIAYRSKTDDLDKPIQDVLTICDKIDRFKLVKKDRDQLEKYLSQSGASSYSEVLQALDKYPDQIKKMNSTYVCYVIKEIVEAPTVHDLIEVINRELRGLDRDYIKADIDVHYKEPQFFRLSEIAKKYGDDFVRFRKDLDAAGRNSRWSRERENDSTLNGFRENQSIKVQLMTATRSKGHEFDAVIILDSNDDEWPNRLNRDIEEERRLFYVAMTRARKYLYFVTPSDRLESRFLLEAGVF